MKRNLIRALAIGVIASGAAAIAGIALYSTSHFGESVPGQETSGEKAFELCLKSKLGLWQGINATCLDRSDLAALWDAALVNDSGQPVSVELTHPSDSSAATKTGATCRQYKEMQSEGWYALSSREMRREAFFSRACGALELLESAAPARETYFHDGAPTIEEMQAIGSAALLRITEAATAKPADIVIEKIGPAQWRLAAGDQVGIIQEISNADFNGDGVEDILIFLYGAQTQGTAMLAAAGLLEKAGVNTPVTLSAAP